MTYFVIRHIKDGTYWRANGTGLTPNLFASRGKAEARRKQLWHSDEHEVLEVTLTIKE